MKLILDALKNPDLIAHIQGDNNYSWIYYRDGRKLLVSKTLGYFEKKLPNFIRIHKTAMVNLNAIQDYTPPPRNKMQAKIHLFNGLTLPVGRRRWSRLKDIITSACELATPPVHVAKPIRSTNLQRIYVVISDQIKADLVEQLVTDRWSQWQLFFFGTETGLLKALSASGDTELPAVILLDVGKESTSSLATLRLIKNNSRLRLIPTLLLAELQNYDLTKLGYASGANSVILQSVNFTYFIQGLEKVFRYWLSTVSAPNHVARLIK
jgi:CheY-like chemotaxis protein